LVYAPWSLLHASKRILLAAAALRNIVDASSLNLSPIDQHNGLILHHCIYYQYAWIDR